MDQHRWPAFMTTLTRAWRRSPAAPEGLAASGISLGQIAHLPPDDALHRLHATPEGLTPGQVKARLRAVGPNQITQHVRHTIFGELVSRSINPLNLLLLTLAAASYLSGDQRVAIVIAIRWDALKPGR